MMPRLLILAAFFLLSACAAKPCFTDEAVIQVEGQEVSLEQGLRWVVMSGRWYGSQATDDGGFREHLVERYPDGTYQIHFRVHAPDGEISDSIEVGRWGVSGKIYFTFFAGWMEDGRMVPADPSDPFHYNAYIIESLRDGQMTYVSEPHGNRYTIRRVDKQFEMPGRPE
ncbi:MAG: hypothetical protein R3270_01115 [Gammaproteobacteria bacterium]|nr:hypothetical protein [Gammaproteobacteria bacterium]